MDNITAIPAFKDNYIWALHRLGTKTIVVVDPGDAKPVLDYLDKNKLSLSGILITHHHWDHSGGIAELVAQYPQIPVYGPHHEAIAGVTTTVQENELVRLSEIEAQFQVIEIPGHTRGHIAYYGHGTLFCGDTLFACGCGRLFEGTPEQMMHSLAKLKQCPADTLIYCGHEYTRANLAFARHVLPKNELIQQRIQDTDVLLAKGLATLPVTLDIELKTNPFLRCECTEIRDAVCAEFGIQEQDPVKIFAHLREWKNRW